MEQNSFYSKKTEKAPEIDFNGLSGELLLEGRSIPTNAGLVYGEALEWIQEYAKKPNLTTNLLFKLDYFNTSSAFWITKIIKTLCSMKFPDRTLFIHMYVDIDELDDIGSEGVREILLPTIDVDEEHVINLCVKLYGMGNEDDVLREIDVFL